MGGRPPEGRKEKQKVRAGLQVRGHAADTPVEDDGGLRSKLGPMGEDLFAQQCLDSLGVPRVEQYDISTDGACPGDRPKGEKKNKKYVPDCKYAATPQIHPLKTTEAFEACYDATVAAFGA